jgi:MauM/NapG family ferredoxin protein
VRRLGLPSPRRALQLLVLALFVFLLAAATWKGSGRVPVDLFGRLDPLVPIQASLASRVWLAGMATAGLVLAATLLFGRFFCGWVCPFGTCLELSDEVVFGRRKRRLPNAERRFRWSKHAVLAAIVVAAILGQGLLFLADPFVWATRLFTFAVFPLFLNAGDLVLGWYRPVLDRLGFLKLARASFDVPGFDWLGLASIGFFGTLVVLGRYQKRLWCRALCPVGALLAFPARLSFFRRRVDADLCTHCDACRQQCETGAILAPQSAQDLVPMRYDPGECIQCQRCVRVCAPGACTFRLGISSTGQAPSLDLGRRRALGAVGIGALGGAWLALEPRAALAAGRVLRPPGALPEVDFLATCVRCGLCSKACPTGCLQPSLVEAGPAGLLTPMASMRLGPCDPNCSACGAVCPTQAIRRLDASEKPFARIGTAVIDESRCIAHRQERACLVCDENCPWGAIDFTYDEKGVGRPSVDAHRCNGCGQCEHACPVNGRAAIAVDTTGQIRIRDGSYEEEARRQGFEARKDDEEPWM